jgi:hypothetical protein
MKNPTKAYNLEACRPDLLKEWDYEKNTLPPSSFLPGTPKKVWWICEKGHSWEARIGAKAKGHGCPCCSGRTASCDNNLEKTAPELLKYWDYDKNTISPCEITAASNRKVWWICSTCSYVWYANPNSRKLGNRGCRRCSGQISSVNYNLKICYPVIADDWDYSKNTKTPEDYTPKSGERVWWVCKNRHSIFRTIRDRVMSEGCTACRQQEVSVDYNFAKERPDLLKEWNWDRNLKNPDTFFPNSETKVWWICKEKHEWESSILNRCKIQECPYCSKKRATKEYNFESIHPELAKEWDCDKNKSVPSDFLPNSEVKVWWICKNGHSWSNQIAHRVAGAKCPYCTNKIAHEQYNLKLLFPKLMEEWNYDKNLKAPETYTPQSHQSAWWLCSKGHEWKSSIANRTGRGNGCPTCACSIQRSKAEIELFEFVKRTYPGAIPNSRKEIKPLELDIYIPELKKAIEYDGTYWHSKPKAKNRTARKKYKCKKLGIKLLIIPEKKYKKDPESVKKAILEFLAN